MTCENTAKALSANAPVDCMRWRRGSAWAIIIMTMMTMIIMMLIMVIPSCCSSWLWGKEKWQDDDVCKKEDLPAWHKHSSPPRFRLQKQELQPPFLLLEKYIAFMQVFNWKNKYFSHHSFLNICWIHSSYSIGKAYDSLIGIYDSHQRLQQQKQ